MSTGHPRRPTRGVVRLCVGGLRRPVVPSKSESGGALPQPAPVLVTTGESEGAMHRGCLKVSGYKVIGRARGDLGAKFAANVQV